MQFIKKHKNKFIIGSIILIVIVGVSTWWINSNAGSTQFAVERQLELVESSNYEDMIVAGGCFWCVEADMEKAPGVVEVISGYSGGEGENPTYKTYASQGHREVVRVIYNPDKIDYRSLTFWLIKHIDPTDGQGSFVDRGVEYSPAIYYETEEEKQIAEEVLRDIESRGVFEGSLQTPVLAEKKFWPAEEYHQDFYKKNPVRYGIYRKYSGRDSFIEKHWGEKADVIPEFEGNEGETKIINSKWESFEKPSDDELKQTLSSTEYRITQKDGTEIPFNNEYWDNEEEGIYVDIVSGEPLFSSKDKYESGTGWPSFTKPLEPSNIVTKSDYLLSYKRIEVRSKYGDSHLGHVFGDGPTTIEESGGAEPTGLRYCLNSAALRFVPKEDLKEKGYGKYLSLFN